MSLAAIKKRVKARETPFYDRLYRIAMGVRGLSFPVIGPLHRFLYKEWVFRRTVWHDFWRKAYYEPMFKSQCAEVGSNFRMQYAGNGSTTILGRLEIRLGSHVTMFDNTFFSGIISDERPRLTIGDHNYLAPLCRIVVAREVTIGNWNLVGCRFIADNSGHPVSDVEARLTSGGGLPSAKSIKPVRIGDFCYLATQTVVYPGTTVGDGVVAQIGTHLCGNIPPFTLVGGNPMRIIGKLPIPESMRERVGEERYQAYLKAHEDLEFGGKKG
ncbi:acyltransferase [Salidesulfovibrio brasiliensis]|uniref:acyltransferase n=1 Tax=Salidesulfovibrio brasiliensis TaxID=221711 RepID=UPI0006D110BE|nr:acetyltransferase [Salidesulfovibrio brasiliensis]